VRNNARLPSNTDKGRRPNWVIGRVAQSHQFRAWRLRFGLNPKPDYCDHCEGRHSYPRHEGEQTFEIEGIGTKVVKAGEMVYTPPNTPHYGRNATDELSKTLVVRIKAKDQPVMTEVKHN
jgi:ribosomal protein L16 Arg81 hydroxylase